MNPDRIRLAAVSYLNTAPLIAALEDGSVSGYQVSCDVPSQLPALIESGRADLGLLPAGYCATHPELVLAPGAGIACRGPVRSILLICAGDARSAHRVAMTTTSISSVGLLRLLYHHRYEVEPEFSRALDPVEELRAGRAEAALLIGDPALQADTAGFRVYDLGEEWFRMTGLPFVFAFWAGTDKDVVERAAPDLVRAMILGRERIPELAQRFAPSLGLPVELCEDYLSHYIVHDIGESEMAGYEQFQNLLNESRPDPSQTVQPVV